MNHRLRLRLFDDSSDYVDRFGLLLLITVLAIVLVSIVDLRAATEDWLEGVGAIALSVLVAATLLLSLRASGVRSRIVRIADIVVAIGVVATISVIVATLIAGETANTPNAASPSLVWIALSVGAPFFVVRRLALHRRATSKTLLGAVSAYLLIALAFNFIFLALDAFGSSDFFGVEEPTTSFMYFSLVTITTLGYGDLSPVGSVGRLLATGEAVIGQVYLVTFVAMIVGLLVAQRPQTQGGE